MRSRMERYEKEEQREISSRANKNQELYENIGRNTKYTNFTDVTNANAFDLGTAQKNYRTREGYHQMKEYNTFISEPKVKKELDEFNYLYQDHENKVYDINSVIAEAKKNRIKKDELEAKRKLKNTNYNILASLNPEELEKYRKEKVERTKPDEEELRSLIDTITSKTLAGEIDQATSVDLLSDLMATNIMDRVEKPEPDSDKSTDDDDEIDEDTFEETGEIEERLSLSKEILDKDQIEKVNKLKEDKESGSIMDESDTDFYTRSMDLSDKDFEMDDEFKEKKLPTAVKIILIILIIAVIAIAGYFIYKNFF
ncbi:MAG: hypothetical protein SOU84_02880 [Candidatus Faecimonas sp.]|nr:hypothetical protein [Mycoplasmatota bacterium]MDY2908084.1 hypothetical protein [Candidatus Faecimonas sp.]